MKISTLEIENGKKNPIRIAVGSETPDGMIGMLYLDNIPNYFSLLKSLNFPFDDVYNLNGKGKGLVCRMDISPEAKRFLSRSPNDYLKEDQEFSDLILKISGDTSVSRIQ